MHECRVATKPLEPDEARNLRVGGHVVDVDAQICTLVHPVDSPLAADREGLSPPYGDVRAVPFPDLHNRPRARG